MASASYSLATNRRRASPRQRATSLALAIAVEVLLALVLLTLAPRLVKPPREIREPSVFGLSPDAEPTPARQMRRVARQAKSHPPTAEHANPAQLRPNVAPTPDTALPGIIPMNLASSDISKVARHPGDHAPEAADGDAEADSHPAYGPGEGPGGERLYDVAWYREPTDAELAFYMPQHELPPDSSATIACRMIEHYHVDNCRPLSESPPGSGLARAMREAAWQFLVIPPRVGGKSLTGTWVRIYFSFGKPGSG